MFKKILIANRGEVAVRIIRACQELGISTVAVHSTADQDAMHVRLADETVCIGPGPASHSYLNISAILTAAHVTNADAIHPGFGFLAENANFAAMVKDHQIHFIGPNPEHIAIMGDKIAAKRKALELGMEVIEGSSQPLRNYQDAQVLAQSIGYPILLKASAGGGGKGMRVVDHPDQLKEQLSQAQMEAQSNFGNDQVYLERYLSNPRHIEFQILADHQGNVVCLGERDCSLQRKHQKVWEEAPCASLPQEIRQKIMAQCIQAMKAFEYRNIGTIEFLYQDEKFYFIEMNTRLQVEHPITEMITGIDIVKTQIALAAGQPLGFCQEDIRFQGHAIECRINAEHPQTFAPSPGKITSYQAPGGPGVRVDSALFVGYQIPPYYDSMIAKLIVYGKDRPEALARLNRALHEYVIDGVNTLLPLHQDLLKEPDIQQGNYDVKWLEDFIAQRSSSKNTSVPLLEIVQ